MSSHESLDTRLTELTRQLDQKDTELDQEVDDIIQADLDALDRALDEEDKDLREGLKKRVEAAKKAPKDRASKEAENALRAYPKIILRYTVMQQDRCTNPR